MTSEYLLLHSLERIRYPELLPYNFAIEERLVFRFVLPSSSLVFVVQEVISGIAPGTVGGPDKATSQIDRYD